jgi:alkylation response protein AidB-like acyl-CoA dehydrogenase
VTAAAAIGLDDDQELFRETVRTFLERESPLARVRSWIDEPHGFPDPWWRQAAELGFTSLLVGEADGGGSISGAGLVDLLVVAREAGRLVSPGPLVPANVVADAVSAHGTAEQRAQVLPGVLSGTLVPVWCEAGTVEVSTEGDSLVLRGRAERVEAAGRADLFLVTATGPDGGRQVLVPADAPGLAVAPRAGIDLLRRFGDVELDDVRVSRAAGVDDGGDVGAAVARQVAIARVLRCAEMAGAMERVFEFTVEYLGDRYAAGRPLSSYQVLKHYLADMKLWLEAAHGVTTLAARAVQDATAEAEELVAACCAYVGEHATEFVQKAVQLHGGIGITWEHDLHLYLRRVTLARSLVGATSAHLELLAGIGLGHREQRP